MKQSLWGALALVALVSLPTVCQAHTTYEAAIKAAAAHAQANQHALAIEDLKEAVRLTKNLGDRDQAWLDIAQAYLAQGDRVHAREAWQTLRALPDASDQARSKAALGMAEALNADEKYPEARAMYEGMLREAKTGATDAGGRAAIRFMIGETYLFEGQYARSRQEFAALLAEPKTSPALTPMIQLQVGESYLREGNWQGGRREATKFLDQLNAALPKAPTEEQGTLMVLLSAARGQLGDSYGLEKQWDKAKAEYTTALADTQLPDMFRRPLESKLKVLAVIEGSKLPDKTMYLTYRTAFAAAAQAQQARNYEVANLAAQQAVLLADSPLDETRARFVLAGSYQDLAMPVPALEQFREIVKSGALGTVATMGIRVSVGRSETQLEHYAAARDAFIAVLETDISALQPQEQLAAALIQSSAQSNLAQSYFQEKNYAQAQVEYQKLLLQPQLTEGMRRTAEEQLKQIAALQTAKP